MVDKRKRDFPDALPFGGREVSAHPLYDLPFPLHTAEIPVHIDPEKFPAPGEVRVRVWLDNGWGLAVAHSPTLYCSDTTVELVIIRRSADGFEVLPENPVAADVIGWADGPVFTGTLRKLAAL